MKASKNRICVVGIEKLHSDVHEIRPFRREVILQYFLEYRYELGSNLGRRCGKDREYSVSKIKLVWVGYLLVVIDLISRCPSPKHPVFEVDHSWSDLSLSFPLNILSCTHLKGGSHCPAQLGECLGAH